MKIGIFSISHPLKKGAGASQVSLSIAEYLANKANSVDIISLSNEKYDTNVNGDNIKILTFNSNIFPDFSYKLFNHSIFSRYDKVLISGCDHFGFAISIIFAKIKKATYMCYHIGIMTLFFSQKFINMHFILKGFW